MIHADLEDGVLDYSTQIQHTKQGSSQSTTLGNPNQHLRYIQRNNLTSTPQDLLSDDLAKQISLWQAAGECLLIFADMNEHILMGPLAQRIMGLGLDEATHKAWGDTPPHTYIDGSKPIDAVYHSTDHAAVFP